MSLAWPVRFERRCPGRSNWHSQWHTRLLQAVWEAFLKATRCQISVTSGESKKVAIVRATVAASSRETTGEISSRGMFVGNCQTLAVLTDGIGTVCHSCRTRSPADVNSAGIVTLGGLRRSTGSALMPRLPVSACRALLLPEKLSA